MGAVAAPAADQSSARSSNRSDDERCSAPGGAAHRVAATDAPPQECSVELVVVSATGLPDDSDTFSAPDPFVVVIVGSDRFQTEVAENKAQPVWNAHFTVDGTAETLPGHATVRLWEDDTISDDKLGEATVSLKAGAVMDGEWVHHALVMRAARHGQAACIVEVRVRAKGFGTLSAAQSTGNAAVKEPSSGAASSSSSSKASARGATPEAKAQHDTLETVPKTPRSSTSSSSGSSRADADRPASAQNAHGTEARHDASTTASSPTSSVGSPSSSAESSVTPERVGLAAQGSAREALAADESSARATIHERQDADREALLRLAAAEHARITHAAVQAAQEETDTPTRARRKSMVPVVDTATDTDSDSSSSDDDDSSSSSSSESETSDASNSDDGNPAPGTVQPAASPSPATNPPAAAGVAASSSSSSSSSSESYDDVDFESDTD
jgi:hypothetical protein